MKSFAISSYFLIKNPFLKSKWKRCVKNKKTFQVVRDFSWSQNFMYFTFSTQTFAYIHLSIWQDKKNMHWKYLHTDIDLKNSSYLKSQVLSWKPLWQTIIFTTSHDLKTVYRFFSGIFELHPSPLNIICKMKCEYSHFTSANGACVYPVALQNMKSTREIFLGILLFRFGKNF